MAQEGKTVTVLYYNQDELFTICSAILENLPVNRDDRVILPVDFRRDKIIVAVMEGECKILNCLGDRDFGPAE